MKSSIFSIFSHYPSIMYFFLFYQSVFLKKLNNFQGALHINKIDNKDPPEFP